MKSARIVKVKEPLKVEQVDKPSSRGPQVIVKVQACGVCHSDIHLWEGGCEGPSGKFLKTTDRGISYPLTPGHEIAGTVDSVGEEVKGFSGGEKVIVYPWIGEVLCPACRISATIPSPSACIRTGAIRSTSWSQATGI